MTPVEAAETLAVWYQAREAAHPHAHNFSDPASALFNQRSEALALAVQVLTTAQQHANAE